MKLNTDGAKSSLGSSGGGVLRDQEGEFIAGFSIYYGTCSSPLHAEIMSIKEGITLVALQMGYADIQVESDYKIAVKMITGKKESLEPSSLSIPFSKS